MRGYKVSKELLNQLLECTGSMLEVGVFMCNEHRDKIDDFRSDVICDGVEYRLQSNYDNVKRLVNIICNDSKVGE